MNAESPVNCPAWDQFIIPVLELASKGEISRKGAPPRIPEMMEFTDGIMNQRLNSGHRRVDHRIGRAMSHLTKAGLIKKVRRAIYTITESGVSFLEQYRNVPITYHHLQEVEGYKEAGEKASAKRREQESSESKKTVLGNESRRPGNKDRAFSAPIRVEPQSPGRRFALPRAPLACPF